MQPRPPANEDMAASGLCPDVVGILRKPVSAYPKSRIGKHELVKAVKEALRLQMIFEGRKAHVSVLLESIIQEYIRIYSYFHV